MLTLIDGRPELAEEIESASSALCTYVKDELSELRAEPYFGYAIDGATAGYGPVGAERAGIVRTRLDDLLS